MADPRTPHPYKHRPWLARRVHEGRAELRAVCNCGVVYPLEGGSPGWASVREKPMLQAEIGRHLEEVAAALPEGARCTDRRRHRTPPHERCPLCAAQAQLPLGLTG